MEFIRGFMFGASLVFLIHPVGWVGLVLAVLWIPVLVVNVRDGIDLWRRRDSLRNHDEREGSDDRSA